MCLSYGRYTPVAAAATASFLVPPRSSFLVATLNLRVKVGKFPLVKFCALEGEGATQKFPHIEEPIWLGPWRRGDISGKQSQTSESTLRKEGRDYCPQPTHTSQHHPRPPTKEPTKSFCGVGSMMGFIYASRIVYRDWLSSLSRLPLSSREKNRCFKGVIHLLRR